MCVIILGEKKHIPLDILKKAEQSNPHGAGLAWINEKKQVEYIKSEKLTAQNIFDFIKSEKIKLPYVIHFRITSVGETCDQLCHPFKLSSNDNTIKGIDKAGVLFHNGTYHGFKMDLELWKLHKNTPKNDKEFNGKMSDSRAMSLLANEKRLGLKYLDLIPNGNKLVVLTPKGIKRYGNDWKKVEGLQCSNNYFDFSRFDYGYESCEGSYYIKDNKKTKTNDISCSSGINKNALTLKIIGKHEKKTKNTDKLIKDSIEDSKKSNIPSRQILYYLKWQINDIKEQQIMNESELSNIENYFIDQEEEEYLRSKRQDLDIELQLTIEKFLKGYVHLLKTVNYKVKEQLINEFSNSYKEYKAIDFEAQSVSDYDKQALPFDYDY